MSRSRMRGRRQVPRFLRQNQPWLLASNLDVPREVRTRDSVNWTQRERKPRWNNWRCCARFFLNAAMTNDTVLFFINSDSLPWVPLLCRWPRSTDSHVAVHPEICNGRSWDSRRPNSRPFFHSKATRYSATRHIRLGRSGFVHEAGCADCLGIKSNCRIILFTDDMNLTRPQTAPRDGHAKSNALDWNQRRRASFSSCCRLPMIGWWRSRVTTIHYVTSWDVTRTNR